MTTFALRRLPRSRESFRTCVNKCAAPGSGLRNAVKVGVFLDTYCEPYAVLLCSKCAREWAAIWTAEIERLHGPATAEPAKRAKMPATAHRCGAGQRRSTDAGPQSHQEMRVPDAAIRKDTAAVADLSRGADETVLVRADQLRRSLGPRRGDVPAGVRRVRVACVFRDLRRGRARVRVGEHEYDVPLAAVLEAAA